MLRPRRLAVLRPAAAPNRSGGAQNPRRRRRRPAPMRRHAMARNDGGSGSTRIRSSVVRGAVGCRRRQSPRRRCPADGWQSGRMVLLPACGSCPMTARRNRISACEQVPWNAASGQRSPDQDPIAQFPLRVRRSGIRAGPPRSHRSSCSTKICPEVGLRPVEVLLSSSRWPGGFPLRRQGSNDQLAALECLREAPVRNRSSDAVTGGPWAHGPNKLGGPPATAAPLRSHLISDVGDCRGVTPTHQPTLRQF